MVSTHGLMTVDQLENLCGMDGTNRLFTALDSNWSDTVVEIMAINPAEEDLIAYTGTTWTLATLTSAAKAILYTLAKYYARQAMISHNLEKEAERVILNQKETEMVQFIQRSVIEEMRATTRFYARSLQ